MKTIKIHTTHKKMTAKAAVATVRAAYAARATARAALAKATATP